MGHDDNNHCWSPPPLTQCRVDFAEEHALMSFLQTATRYQLKAIAERIFHFRPGHRVRHNKRETTLDKQQIKQGVFHKKKNNKHDIYRNAQYANLFK